MSVASTSIEQLSINTIRTLSMDAVQKANSGHPGTPMALAPLAYVLWNEVLRYDPEDPLWPGRDRFVLSAGHASMLLYAILHLAGVRKFDRDGTPGEGLAVPLDQILQFRQLHSVCAGHPEYGEAAGIETTTGPLGQGAANSVGMAIAQRWLSARFDRPGYRLFDYDVMTVCGDGDLMEGVASEAASLAGHLKLSNLCWFYDSNRITIEGSTDLAFTEDVARRFQSYGWRTTVVEDANDVASLRRSVGVFHSTADRPTFVLIKSQIAWGSPNKQGHHSAHGAPLGADEVRATKAIYGWPEEAQFQVPPEVVDHFRMGIGSRGKALRQVWIDSFDLYRREYPALAEEFMQLSRRELPQGWDKDVPVFPADAKGLASRISSAKVQNAIAQHVPWLLGGSADLAESTFTTLTFESAGGSFLAGRSKGRNFHFGVREHGMAGILNGMALSRLRPFGSTFLVFSDYLRPSKRLSAVMRLPVIYIYTHDSIGLGEDGPTHQPIEHLASLRAIPNVWVIRPADANEVAEAWRLIMPLVDRPVCLVLTRQNIPTLDRARYAPASGLARGGYILADPPDGKPDVLLLATGSEVQLCTQAFERLAEEGIKARVVSLPCFELFDAQSDEYRESVLPASVRPRLGVEMGVDLGWRKYLGRAGRFIGMDRFGASAPGGMLAKYFGFTVENVISEAKAALG
jgi:transketolase